MCGGGWGGERERERERGWVCACDCAELRLFGGARRGLSLLSSARPMASTAPQLAAGSDPPPTPSAFSFLACAMRSRVRSLLDAAGLPEWFSPADLAALLVGAGTGSTLALLFQPLLGAWIFAEGCFFVWQSYR